MTRFLLGLVAKSDSPLWLFLVLVFLGKEAHDRPLDWPHVLLSLALGIWLGRWSGWWERRRQAREADHD